MPDLYRVLVTGSRTYGDLHSIIGALNDAHDRAGARTMIVVHGQCDPRHPVTGEAILWAEAKLLPADEQSHLLSADWLADWVAAREEWPVERYPAHWQHLGKKAGPARNQVMVDVVAAGAGECIGAISPCESPSCRQPKPHNSHGTADCLERARKAGIEVKEIPGG